MSAIIKTKQFGEKTIYQISNLGTIEYATQDARCAEKYCEDYYGCDWGWETPPRPTEIKIFDDLTLEYCTSAREYFMVLRLAILHITGDYLEKSHEIAQYNKSDEIYKLAIKILKALNR